MKKAGKFLLFLSSYLPLFLVLLLGELFLLPKPVRFTNQYFTTHLVGFILIGLYFVAIALSSWSIVTFKKVYRFGTASQKKIVKIESITNSSSEVISYLLTLVIPLLNIESISSTVQHNEWFKLCSMLIILFVVITIYLNSNLVVINPTLMMLGYRFYKISVNADKESPLLDAVLITSSQFDPQNIKAKIELDHIDNEVYLYKVPR